MFFLIFFEKEIFPIDGSHGHRGHKLSADSSDNKMTENEPYYSYILYSFVPFQLFTQK
jgi:hypothetical protein